MPTKKKKPKAPAISGEQRTMPEGKRFQPGQSGNPAGVSKVTLEMRRLLLEEGVPEAVEYLRRCVRGDQTDISITMMGNVKVVPMRGKERIAAGKHILEFGHPKPKQEVEVTGKDGQPLNPNPPAIYDLSALSVDELITWKKLRAKAKVRGESDDE